MKGCMALLVLLVALPTTRATLRRIWTIAIGHEWGGHEYIDEDGYLNGIGFELINLVCSSGDMDCRIMWDKYENCWNHEKPGERPSGGKGLLGRWYDACTGWVPTVERIHTFQFTVPYMKQVPAYFYVLKHNTFDPSDLLHKKVALLDGWAANEQCLARQTKIKNNVLDTTQIKIFVLPKDLIEGLQRGEADAAFTSPGTWTVEQDALLDRIETPIPCYLGGNGMMSRKDNPFTATWNVAFSKLREMQKFNKFCHEQNIKHGRGNVTPSAEFNFITDVEAAHVTLHEITCPITLVSWDLCSETIMDWAWFDGLMAVRTKRGIFHRRINEYTEKRRKEVLKLASYISCDPMAMAVALDPTIITQSKKRYCAVELNGQLTRGQMVVDWREQLKNKANIDLVLEVDLPRLQALYEQMVQ